MIMKRLIPFLLLFSLLSVSCIDKTPVSEAHSRYVGLWTNNAGFWIQIEEDGTGSFEIPGSSITGGAAAISDSVIVISMLGFDANFEVNKKPHLTQGNWILILDGVKYYQQ